MFCFVVLLVTRVWPLWALALALTRAGSSRLWVVSTVEADPASALPGFSGDDSRYLYDALIWDPGLHRPAHFQAPSVPVSWEHVSDFQGCFLTLLRKTSRERGTDSLRSSLERREPSRNSAPECVS